MASRTHLKLSPSLLKWARETLGLPVEAAAKRIGLKLEKLKQWEAEEATPTPRQLEKVADVYSRPVASFFLDTPPIEPPLPIDFRSGPGEPTELSAKTRLAIRKARWLQSVYGELVAERSAPAAIPRVATDAPEVLAEAMRRWLAVPLDGIQGKQPSEVLAVWRKALEASGILLFQFPIPIAEVRAFSLMEKFPAIVLSSKDSYPARVFSLFHELGHILLGRPGLCLPEVGRPRRDSSDVERLCNAAAGLALVPTKSFLAHGRVDEIRRGADLHDSLASLARAFGVSRQVVLRRLADTSVISWNAFSRMMNVLRAEFEAQEERKKKRKIVVPPSVKAVARLGNKFVNDALEARARGDITEADLTEFLGLKLQHVSEVEAIVGTE